jgi:hypothetical protein
MEWIKRNLYFVIGTLVALALLGGAGWYFYSSVKANAEVLDKLHEQYATLATLNSATPHPGRPPHSDNIKIAKDQQQQLRGFKEQAQKAFQAIPGIPEGPRIAGEDFISALRHTIDQLQKQATNSSVGLPTDYSFSFATQKSQMRFATNVLGPLSIQLGEVKAICDVLFQAKINTLEYIHRERITPEDSSGTTDYINQKSVTNDLAVLTPYELKFKCFTPELALALSGFASSPNGLIVKTINVELAPAIEAAPETTQVAPQQVFQQPAQEPVQSKRVEQEFRRRYGLDGKGRSLTPAVPTPQVVVPQPGAVSKPALQTVLDEKQLMVTLLLNVVKMLPSKEK